MSLDSLEQLENVKIGFSGDNLPFKDYLIKRNLQFQNKKQTRNMTPRFKLHKPCNLTPYSGL